MSYTCQNCGASADEYNSLCNPTSGEFDAKFCGAPAMQVCEDKLDAMKFSCDSCGSVSAEEENLCNPRSLK